MTKAATGMKLPGPDHPITISRNGGRVRVTFAGRVIADTTQALTIGGSELQAGALHSAQRCGHERAASDRPPHALPL